MVHARQDGEATLTRMLAHLDCHPIAGDERRIADAAPVGSADRTLFRGWHRVVNPGEYTISDDTHTVTFARSRMAWRNMLGLVARALPTGWKLGPSLVSQVNGAPRMFAPLTTPDGSGVAVAWSCGDESVLGYALGYDDAAARALPSAMHCSGPGEAPLLAP